jgi:DNA-binding NtrC family response regulator
MLALEKTTILDALRSAHGNLPAAAKILGCSWRTLYRRIEDDGALSQELERIREGWCPTCQRPL